MKNSIGYLILKSFFKKYSGTDSNRSYSQDGEDVLAAIYLRTKKGVYVDVGAYHPIQYSNTYHFYKKGWSGVVIDPNPTFNKLYSFFRPRDVFVRSGIATESANKEYFVFSDGAYNTFSKERADEIAKNSYPKLKCVENRMVRPLSTILEEKHISRIDFLSVDVEGLETEVLQSHNWDIRPKVIAIEDNNFNFDSPHESELYRYLSKKGYKLVAGSPRTPIFVDSAVVV